MQELSNTYLQRGKGKVLGNIKKADFFKFYKKNAKETQLSQIAYNAFLKELLNTYSEEIVLSGLILKLGKLGRVRVRTKKLHLMRKDGSLSKSLKVDWKSTWEFWLKKYPGLSKEEIVSLTHKKVLYHDNSHSLGEFYMHYWDKLTATVKFQKFYDFKPARQYSRLLSQTVKDPQRKIFYFS